MKSKVRIGMLALLLLITAGQISYALESPDPSMDASNLLVNPSLEQGQANRPLGWQSFALPGGEGDITFAWDNDFAATGTHSARIDVEGSRRGIWSQSVSVEAHALYEISGYIAFESLHPTSDAHLQIVFRDEDHRALSFVDLAGHNSGGRGFALDFPARMIVRAPKGATSAEINGYLRGSGTLWIDDITFAPAPVGSIHGRVTSGGEPLEGVRVFLWGDPWDEEIAATTSAQGEYELPGIPVSHPRYIAIAKKHGYRTQPIGDIDIIHGQPIRLDFDLVWDDDPKDTLQVGYGFIAESHAQWPVELPTICVLPDQRSDYPEAIQPYLDSDDFVTVDDSAIQALATDILASIPAADRDNAVAVARAVFDWISTTLNHDAVYGNNQPYRDVTSGIWQTIQPGGWCWGRNLYDWLYRPAELLAEGTGICIEHAWLSAALLRALNIPARARVGSAQFWLATGDEDGTWFGFSTNGGSNTYRETGRMGAGFGGSALPTFFSSTSEPFLQEDWDWDQPGLWREQHPWGEVYPATANGLSQAVDDLEHYANTGEAVKGSGRRSPGEGAIEINYSQIELGLWNLGDQRVIDVRFPAPTDSKGTSDTGIWQYWTNHPECVITTYEEVIDDEPSGIVQTWRHIVVDVTALLDE